MPADGRAVGLDVVSGVAGRTDVLGELVPCHVTALPATASAHAAELTGTSFHAALPKGPGAAMPSVWSRGDGYSAMFLLSGDTQSVL